MTSRLSSAPRMITVITVCALSAAVCWGLAWWQWERYSAGGGSLQNLGYVLQWPLFGLFPAFVFWRMHVLRRNAEQMHSTGHGDREDAQEAARNNEWPPARDESTSVGPSLSSAALGADSGDSDDGELAAYNRYLAELHARDK